MPASPAVFAAAIALRPLVDLPSDSSTIAAGAGWPFGSFEDFAFVRSDVIAVAIASPLAVPPLDCIFAIAVSAASRSVLGVESTVGVWLNAMIPTLTLAGTLSTNA